MKKICIAMLWIVVAGQFAPLSAAQNKGIKPAPFAKVQKVEPTQKQNRFSNISYVKLEKFMKWYENSLTSGKVLSDCVTKSYEKVKLHLKASMKGTPVARKKIVSQSAVAKAHYESKCSHPAKSCLKKYILDCKHFGKKGVVITKPGYYCLAENVGFKPSQDHVPAITIRSHNVILDLSTHTLSECPSSFDQFDDTSAIVVESGYNGITIKNGKIRNFSNCGVLVLSENSVATDHFGIVIEDIVVNSCGKITTANDLAPFNARHGIGVYGTTDCIIQNCITSEITSLVDTEAVGTFFTDNLLIKNCISQNNTSDPDTGFTEGFEINFFNNVIIEECLSAKNTGSQVVGIIPIFGTSVVVVECQANENSSLFPTVNSPFAGGILINFVDGAVLARSEGNFNVAKGELLGSSHRKFATGIQIAVSTATVTECSANFNLATSDTGLSQGGCVGFDINTVDSCIVKNCWAEGNSNFSTDVTLDTANGVFGFDCDTASNVLFENCVAIANNAQEGGTPTRVAGFYASIFPEGGTFSNIVYKNCASFNHVSDFAGSAVAGFLIGEPSPTAIVLNPNQIVLDECIAEGNVNSATPDNGAGISFENGTTASSVLNCILKGNGVGIRVRGADTVANLFEKNEITANAVYGIEDTTDNLNSYAKNYAYNVDATANYIGLPAGTPIRSWQIGTPPAPVDNNGILDPIDNLDVFN